MIGKHDEIYAGITETLTEVNIPGLVSERQPKVKALIDDFIQHFDTKYGVRVETIDNACEKLCYAYFILVHDTLKSTVEDKLNRYKMASIMELLIVKEQILIHPDSSKDRYLNSLFALSAGLSLVNSMICHDTNEGFYVDTSNVSINDRLKKIIKNHRLWLESKNLDEMPVFVNSQFHEMIEVMAGASYEMH